MKKTLAILLTLALVLCMMPGAAFAETATPTTAVDLSTATVIVTNNAVIYNGSAQYPTVVVKVGETALTAGTDYTVTYKQGGTDVAAPTEAGTYSIIVTGTAAAEATTGYTGTATVTDTHVISKVDFNNVTLSYSGSTSAASYTGDVGATYNSVTGLVVKIGSAEVPADLYTVTAEKLSANSIRIYATPKTDNVNVTGPARTLDVNLTTPLSGYQIIGTGTNGAIPNQVYTGSAIKPTVYVVPVNTTSTTNRLTEGKDYKLEYTNNTVGSATATVTAIGMGNYSDSISAQFYIAGKAISYVSISVENTVQGEKPKVTVTDGTKTLVEGTDYTIYTYDSNNIGTSTGKVTIQGIHNYSGTKDATYRVIDPNKEIEQADVASATQSVYYNGTTQPVSVVVKVGTTTLSQGYDYTVTYTNTSTNVTTTAPKDAGTYTINVTGAGQYASNGALYGGTLTIKPFDTDWLEVTASAGYTTSTPYVYVRSLDGAITFVQDKDYKITNTYTSTYTNKVTVYITTMGNIESDSLTAEYSIVGKNIAYCTTEFATGSKQYNNYTGSTIKPTIRVRDGYTLLSAGSDYTVTYKDAAGKVVAAPKDAGTYTIEITGKGAYSGTATMYYYIVGTDISSYTVTLKADSAKADGTAKTPVISSVKYGFYSTLSSADYTVTYEDYLGNTVSAYSIKTPGTYKVIVTGKGGYSGSTYAYFTIVGTPQEITIDKTSYKVYVDSDSFRIKATATGDGTGFSYVSSDSTVASVSSTGLVTIHKLGRAKITVTTTGMKKSDPASDDVYVKVHPDKSYITKKPWTEGKKNSLRVRWEIQEDATKYQIRYSTTSSFKSYKTKTVTASELYDTQSTRLTGLKSGTKYYIKVRAVKEVKNDYGQTLKYYGKWSNWRSGTAK